MRLIDERGRLFGRLNLVDAAVLVFILILLPTLYGAYVLFRVPVPVITAVQPATVVESDALRVRLLGENLMPYLTAYIGRSGEPVSVFLDDRQSSLARFLIETPSAAELDLPRLSPGSYDVYLYSEAEQLAHFPNAFTVTLPPEEEMRLQTPPPPPVRSVARVRVDFVLPRRYATRPRTGDRDRFGSPTLSGEPDATALSLELRPAPAYVPNLVDPVLLVGEFSVPVTKSEQGLWWYKGQRIRPGEWLAFGDVDYYIYGLMVDTDIPDEAPWDEEP